MKKILFLAVAAAICFTSQVFAGESEIVLKAGVTPVSSLENDIYIENYYGYGGWRSANSTADIGFQADLAYYYFVSPFVGIGFGVNEQFSRKIHNLGDLGYTSIYFAIKPRIPLQTDSEDLYAFFTAAMGFSFVSQNLKYKDVSFDANNGGYFGLGAGIQFYNFLVELMYSINTSGMDYSYFYGNFYSYSAYEYYSSLYINVGYRFKIS